VQLVASVGSLFERCRFERMRIADASFGSGRETSTYRDCSFDGTRTKFMGGGFARFERCSFQDVDFREWFCFTVEFVDCVFSGSLRGCVFNGKVPDDDVRWAGRTMNQITGNDFSRAELWDVGFRTGVDLTAQRLPSGPAYRYISDAASAAARARAAIITWDDLDFRQSCLRILASMEAEVASGQRQWLLRTDAYPKSVRRHMGAIIELLDA
jgi:hypothetical protein